MALGKTLKDRPELLDQLCVLNELVKALSGTELKELVSELKAEKAALDASHVEHRNLAVKHDNKLAELNKKIAEHEDLSSANKARKAELDDIINDHAKQLQKLQNAQNVIDSAAKMSAMRHATQLAELEAKSKDLADRELRLAEHKKLSNAVKSEYEAKLNDLKKITG